jgi:adenylate cyclase
MRLLFDFLDPVPACTNAQPVARSSGRVGNLPRVATAIGKAHDLLVGKMGFSPGGDQSVCSALLRHRLVMIHVYLKTPDNESEFDHAAGPLEFGRGPQRDAPRQIVNDPYVSGDHLRIEELNDGQLRITNLSEHVAVGVDGDEPLATGLTRNVDLPARLSIGHSEVRISAGCGATDRDHSARTLDPAYGTADLPSLRELGQAPGPETLARWFETVICVQQAAASSSEFYRETARAVAQLVGLDLGLVILREQGAWKVVARHPDRSLAGMACPGEREFSRWVVDEVFRTGRTWYQTAGSAPASASLRDIEAVVAAPIFDSRRRVAGVVYGCRTRAADVATLTGDMGETGISSLEAQVIQVLAAAVGAGVERVRQEKDAMRSQLQFENFFSAKLAAELARDTNLLEGRQREITVVFSDVRDFTLISQHLGPQETFHMMQDVMDLQTSIIRNHDGVVVDYVGDGLFAMWNAPTDQPDHARLACQAVLDIMRQLPGLDRKWRPMLNRPLQLGVGINTGNALVGNTGSRVKFKYGPMGPVVNLASRVEEASKQLGPDILMTESTYRQLDDSFACRRLCQASLSGIVEPVYLFELSSGPNTPEWQRRRTAFETALEHFHARRWADACLAIYPLISDTRGEYDVVSLQLLARAVECLRSNPDPFDPVVHLD